MGSNPHDVVEDPGQLSKEHPDILGPEGHVDVEQLLNSQRIGLFIAHHGHIVKSIKVGESLHIFNFKGMYIVHICMLIAESGKLTGIYINYINLQICLVLNKLLSASVKKPNVGVSSCHCLTIQLKDQPR